MRSRSIQNTTTVGGYGNALYQRDFNAKIATATLERLVLFVGHRFGRGIAFFSEIEIEDAKVSGGENGGEVAVEQAYVRFNLIPNHYATAGLFIPRIGILNEDHLPTSFNGNERTQVETNIIPSTWRELGVGFYGSEPTLGLYYSAAVVNGLNSEGFRHGSVIRGGRFEGRRASANNLAVTGAVQIHDGDFKFQLSGYYGGSVGLATQDAETLKLASGMFGTPVLLAEADAQYEVDGFSTRILGTMVTISNAFEINRAYGNNTPQQAFGAYIEAAYNVLEGMKGLEGQTLALFVRYEKLDMNQQIPSNATLDPTLRQDHVTAGLSFLPTPNVVVKADARFMHSGTPSPTPTGFKPNNTFLNLGVGYSF
ncbi:MAG: hypothetical protein WBD36_07850 [Bacteroidota bacterium]